MSGAEKKKKAAKEPKRIKRNSQGLVMPGTAPLNPEGNNGERRKGLAPWKKRLEQLSAKYPTYETLMALWTVNEDTGHETPTKELRDMNPLDVGILMQLRNSMEGKNTLEERESIWNRHDGKPKENKVVRVIKGWDDLTEEELAALAGED